MSFTVTLYAYDLLTGDYIGTIPYRGLSFGAQLNAAGSMQFNLDTTDPRVQNFDYIASTEVEHACIVVDYDNGADSIPFAYIVSGQQTGRDDQGAYTYQVSGTDFWGFFAQQVQPTDYTSPPYSGITGDNATMPIWNAASLELSSVPYAWDPMLIAAQIIHDALTVPSTSLLGGLGLYLNGYGVTDNGAAYLASGTGTPSANYVAESFPFTSLQTVDTLVNQLSQLGYGVGLDYGVDTVYSGGAGSPPFVAVNLSYPRRGAPVSQTNLTVDASEAYSYSFPTDGSSTANTVYETGGNQDIVATQNIYAIEAGYPNLAKVINRSELNSANVTALLSAMGLSDLRLFSFPPVAPTVTIPLDSSQCGLGSFIVGDDVQLVVPQYDQDLKVFDPRFPAGLNAEWRITQWEATVNDQGVSTLALTLDSPPSETRTTSPI